MEKWESDSMKEHTVEAWVKAVSCLCERSMLKNILENIMSQLRLRYRVKVGVGKGK